MNGLDIDFQPQRIERNNCLCYCCHNTGKVLKIKIPSTLFHNGKTLTTKYREMWLCEKCEEKLRNSLAIRGQWIQGYELEKGFEDNDEIPYVKCSICSHIEWHLDIEYKGTVDFPLHYCPNCGAKMDSEVT